MVCAGYSRRHTVALEPVAGGRTIQGRRGIKGAGAIKGNMLP